MCVASSMLSLAVLRFSDDSSRTLSPLPVPLSPSSARPPIAALSGKTALHLYRTARRGDLFVATRAFASDNDQSAHPLAISSSSPLSSSSPVPMFSRAGCTCVRTRGRARLSVLDLSSSRVWEERRASPECRDSTSKGNHITRCSGTHYRTSGALGRGGGRSELALRSTRKASFSMFRPPHHVLFACTRTGDHSLASENTGDTTHRRSRRGMGGTQK